MPNQVTDSDEISKFALHHKLKWWELDLFLVTPQSSSYRALSIQPKIPEISIGTSDGTDLSYDQFIDQG